MTFCVFLVILQDMNNNHLRSESLYKRRWLAPLLAQAAKEHPVVILTGARKVGKSTLFQQEKPFSHWLRIDLDDLGILEQAERDPASLWMGANDIIIDEVQRSPRLLYVVKQAADKAHHRMHFVLSGSVDLFLMRQINESLAGRTAHFSISPMDLGEIDRR